MKSLPRYGFFAWMFGILALANAAEQPAKSNKMAPLPAGVRAVRDVVYASPGGEPQKLDLYLPDPPPDSPLPVVIWVHGGGWKEGSRVSCPGVWLAGEGYAVASIDYRLIPRAQWPAQMEDCHAAIRWLRSQAATYHLDAAHFAAWGGSAGGHLAALMGTLSAPAEERVQAVIDWYGPAELLTMPPNVLTAKRTRDELAKSNGAQLLGGIVTDLPEKARSASALDQVSGDDPPFLIMHGDHDPSVPLEQSQKLHAKLQAAGVPSILIIIPGAGHGGKEFSTPERRTTILQFLDQHLKPVR